LISQDVSVNFWAQEQAHNCRGAAAQFQHCRGVG
jgi:hypothetical protein